MPEMIETRLIDHNLSSRPRYLRRTWKLFKPYLQASDSLPDLALIPPERPLYTCDSCGFSNARAERCLWCPPNMEKKAKEGEREFQTNYRRRRVSAPALLLCWQESQHTTCRKTTRPKSPRPVSPRTLSRLYLNTARCRGTLESNRLTPPRILYPGNTLPMVEEDGINMVRNIVPAETQASHAAAQLKQPDAVVHGDVVTATILVAAPSCSTSTSRPLALARSSSNQGADIQSASSISSAIGGDQHPSQSAERASFNTDRVDRRSTVVVENPIMNSMTRMTTTSSRSLSSHVLVDLSNRSSHETDFKGFPSSSDPAATQRILRRKKRQSILHMSAPPSSWAETDVKVSLPPRPQSQPSVPSQSTSNSRFVPITKLQTHMRSQSQSDVHLGHPSRPYYTALRPNMSRPSSALDYYSSAGPGSRPSTPVLDLYSFPGPSSSIGHDIDKYDAPTSTTPPFLSASCDNNLSSASTLFPYTPFGLEPDPNPEFTRTNSTSSLSIGHLDLPSFSRKARRHTTPGFSESDEIKLRMALAREVGGKNVKADEGYVYRDLDKRERKGSMKMQMKRIGRGIKDLIKRRS